MQLLKSALLRKRMQQKTVHIVFQVLNFLTDPNIKRPKLLPIDKMILLKLASHHGKRGIFPMQETLSINLETSLRYMKTRLKYLEKTGLIFVEKIHRKNYYHLPFLSTLGDPQITHDDISGDPQITSQVIHRSPHRGSTDATNNKVSNKVNKTERERAPLASPLSDHFEPNSQSCKKAQSLGLTQDDANIEFEKFMTHYQANGTKKKDWQKALENWFIRAAEYRGNHETQPKQETRPQPKDYVPEPAFDREANREVAAKSLGQIFEKLKLNGKGGHHGSGKLHGQVEKGESGKA